MCTPQLEPPRHYQHNIICEQWIYLFGKFRTMSPLRDDIFAIQYTTKYLVPYKTVSSRPADLEIHHT